MWGLENLIGINNMNRPLFDLRYFRSWQFCYGWSDVTQQTITMFWGQRAYKLIAFTEELQFGKATALWVRGKIGKDTATDCEVPR